jgi:hypothetical protein
MGGLSEATLLGDYTGIQTMSNGLNRSETIYNLKGQRVSKAQKGLFIINGKKVVK